jgi:hypothetical protein
MCEVRSRKNGQEPEKKEKKNIVVSSKKKSTVMSPIRCRMKKRNPSSGQNDQLVHWWLLIHFGQIKGLENDFNCQRKHTKTLVPEMSPSALYF